jgi:hypothetical protein
LLHNFKVFELKIKHGMLAPPPKGLIGKSRFSLVERLGFRVARSPFLRRSIMARHLFFAITLIGIGVFLNSPEEAVPDAARCED